MRFIFLTALLASLPLMAFEKSEGLLEKSDIYPGTVHRYTVTVPKG